MPGKKPPFFSRFSGFVLRFFGFFLARVKVEGLENFPKSGPVLVICNHSSNSPTECSCLAGSSSGIRPADALAG
jgi:hypothetical protein